MDVLTAKGRVTLQQEQEAIALFTTSFPAFSFIETPKDMPADIDGFIVRDDIIVSGVEVKCRNMTSVDLKERFDNKWLISADKLERGVAVCKRLCVDFRGFLYLVPDKILMIVPIFSIDQGWLVEPEYDCSETKGAINGKISQSLNAYVDVSGAKVIAEL